MTNEYLDQLRATPATPSAPEAPDNEYLDLLQGDENRRRQALAGNLSQAVTVNPDQYNAKRKVACYLGYPVAAVEALPGLAEQAKTRQVQADIAEHPALQKRFTDADFARLAHDDSFTLSSIGQVVRYLVSAPDAPRGGLVSDLGKAGRSVAAGVPAAGASLWNAMAAPFGVADQVIQSLDNLAATVTGTQRRQIVGSVGPEGFLRYLGAQADAEAKRVAGADPNAGFVEQSVMSGFQSAGQNLVMLPLGLMSQGPNAMMAAMGLVSGGQSYGKARDAGVSPFQSTALGVQDAVAEVVTEKYLGMAGFLKNVKAGASATKLAVFEITKEVPGEMAATLWQNFNEWANVNPDKSLADFIGEQPEALAQTFIATLVGGGTQIGAIKGVQKVAESVMGMRFESIEAQRQADQLAEALKLAGQSKLLERDPAQFRDTLNEMSGDAELRFDARTLADTLQQSGLDPATIEQALPSVASQMADATQAGGEVRVKVGEFMAGVAGTPLEQLLMQHARIGENEMSQAEALDAGSKAGEFLEQQAARVIQQAQDQKAMQDSSDRVRQGLLDQLNTVGRFRSAVNEGYATWAAAFYTTMAGRAGMTPEEFAAKYPLRIVAQMGQGAALEQPAAPATPEFKAWFGDSKVVDPEGKPLVVYHGTRGEFSVFDYSKIGQQGRAEGAGFYFTNNQQVATGYGKPMEVFLSIKKPIAYDAKGFSKAVLHKIIKRVAELESQADGNELADGFLSNFGDVRSEGLQAVVRQAADLVAADETAVDQLSGIVGSGVNPEHVNAATRDATGYDGVVSDGFSNVGGGDNRIFVAFFPEQIKSATGNDGTFDANDPSILSQQARGSFNPRSLELALSENADLSTFFHETGHFFLEVMADLASRPDAPADVQADMTQLLAWFGVSDLEAWQGMTLDEQRPYHERFAESIEQYLIEGKAPSTELAPLFRKFRAWVLNVYRSLKSFLADKPEGMALSDEVRQVFDRMLASQEQISQAEEVAGLLPDENATDDAIEKMTARSIRDLKWVSGARSKAIKALQAEARALRSELRIEARRDIMTQPVYRLWSFLSVRLTDEDRRKTFAERVKSDPLTLDPSADSLLMAIAKLGGIQRASAAEHLGVHPDDFNHPSGVFSKPVFRVEGGRSADAMGELLAENGYLLPKEDGRFDLAELEGLIADEIRGDPQYSIAKQYFLEPERGGEGVDVHELNAGRFDLADLKALGAPEDAVGKLEALKMTLKKGGIHPDIVADAFGFPNGLAMIDALLAAEAPLTAVDGRTDQLMLERHGDLADPRAIEAAANEAIHNQARAKALATELKAQAEALNPRRDTGEVNAKGSKITVNALMEAAKQFGANVVARTPLRDLRSRVAQHTAAERRAASAWRTATQAGQTREAIQAKQDQVLNHAAAKAALDAIAAAKKDMEFFKLVTKGNDEATVDKGRDPDLVNAARAVLAAYGVETATTKRAADYLDVLQKNDPDLWAVVQPMIEGSLQNAQPLEALTFEQLQGLAEEIRALWHLAKRSRQMEVDGDLLDIADAADELRQRMDAIGVPLEVPGEKGAVTEAEKRGRWLQFAGALLRRVEQWAEGMDGKFGGPFLRYVFQPVKAAADAYRTDRVKYRAQFAALLDSVAPSLRKGLIEAPELDYTFGKGHNGIGHAELLHAILHTGNESNKRKLLLGRRWAVENMDGTLDTSRWDAFIQRMHDTGVLGKVHYDFAQGVWDLLESMKPLAQKTHRDVFGRYFAEVTADSFSTPFGAYRGGYVPAQADPLLVQDAELRTLIETGKEGMVHAFPTTSKGFTKGRVEYNRPLMLDLRTLGQHIDKVLLFSHMEPAVRSVNKLMRQKGVSQPLYRIDPSAYSGMLMPWLLRSARQQVETPISGDGRISRVLSVVRQRAGMSLMFANVSNTLQQITGLSTALVKVSAGSLRGAVAQYIAHPKQTAEAVAGASEFMANRMANEIAAINETMNDILLDPSAYERAQAWTQKHAYFLQSAFDNVIGPIVWTGAYNDGLKQGLSERDAVKLADGVVRQTQGSTLPEDVSRIETGDPIKRAFTQFIGYFNMMANTNATALKQIAGEVGLKKGAGKALYVVTMGMLMPIWVAEFIAQAMRGGPDDEDKDGWFIDDWLAAVFGFGTIKGLFAQVPFIGQLAVAGVNRITKNPNDDRVSMSPAVSLLEASVGAPMSVYKAIAEDGSKRQAVRDVASLVSIATGLPVMAAAKPVGYLAGMADDKIEPEGPVDLARGLVTGVPSPESKRQ